MAGCRAPRRFLRNPGDPGDVEDAQSAATELFDSGLRLVGCNKPKRVLGHDLVEDELCPVRTAGLADGQLWQTLDRGDSWARCRLEGDSAGSLRSRQRPAQGASWFRWPQSGKDQGRAGDPLCLAIPRGG